MSSHKQRPRSITLRGINLDGKKSPLLETQVLKKLDPTFRRLRLSQVGLRAVKVEENALYSCFVHLVADIASSPALIEPIKRRLLGLFQRRGLDMRIEELRRLTILAILANFLDDKVVEKVIRAETIHGLNQRPERRFNFTFTLNTIDSRQTLELPDPVCELLRQIDTKNTHAYQRILEFADFITEDERFLIYWPKAEFINHGGKRYVFRIQFGDQNAALLISMSPENPFSVFLAKAEAELYEVLGGLSFTVIKIPKVISVLGKAEEGCIILEDCTKGGNAILTPTQGREDLIPEHLRLACQEDLRILEAEFKRRLGYAPEAIVATCIHIQESRKDPSDVKLILLDAENLLDPRRLNFLHP